MNDIINPTDDQIKLHFFDINTKYPIEQWMSIILVYDYLFENLLGDINSFLSKYNHEEIILEKKLTPCKKDSNLYDLVYEFKNYESYSVLNFSYHSANILYILKRNICSPFSIDDYYFEGEIGRPAWDHILGENFYTKRYRTFTDDVKFWRIIKMNHEDFKEKFYSYYCMDNDETK